MANFHMEAKSGESIRDFAYRAISVARTKKVIVTTTINGVKFFVKKNDTPKGVEMRYCNSYSSGGFAGTLPEQLAKTHP